MDDLIKLALNSVEMKNMKPSDLLVYLEKTNNILKDILKDEESYSYDVYYALLILTHNFRILISPNYFRVISECNYFKSKISSYYKAGGNREVLPYLIDIDSSLKEEIGNIIFESKQQFVFSIFCKGYQGIPNELKYFCELPDFYPEICDDLKDKIFMKK